MYIECAITDVNLGETQQGPCLQTCSCLKPGRWQWPCASCCLGGRVKVVIDRLHPGNEKDGLLAEGVDLALGRLHQGDNIA